MTVQTAASPRQHRQIVRIGRHAAMAAGMAMAVLLPAGQALAAVQSGSSVAGRSSVTGLANRDAPAAPAAPDASSPGTTIANVNVGGAILLSNLTNSFTLTGVPGDLPSDPAAVTMNVFTNNDSGYNVTVLAAAVNLVGTSPNTDTIPVSDISVEESGAGAFQPLSSTVADQVYSQTTRSVAAPGDLLSNAYEFNTGIPDVLNDTYSVTLDYVASTNP
jgi:hypothetical protein